MSDIYTKRKKGESFEALFRRFSRRVQRSGKVLTKKNKLFHNKKASKNKIHTSKLRGLSIAQKRDWMIRVGKLEDTNRRGRRR